MKQRKRTSNAVPSAKEASSVSRVKEMLSVFRAHDILHGLTPEKLRLILEDLGPTFVKLGQIVSMRHDILPASYCKELERLRTDVKPMSYEEVAAIIEQEYGANVREIFSSIEQHPLGSASIAQVHRATLTSGKQVVIKVQRPHIRDIMAKDIALMRRTTRMIKLISSSGEVLDLHTILEEMWIVAQEELDFLIEASHVREFTKLNADIHYVSCPEIEKSLTTSRILVMEYIDGIQIDHLDELKKQGYDLNEIGLKLAQNYVKQILDDAFFHADPHPGNIWIRGGKIVWLDLGMMGRLSRRDQQLLRTAVTAIVQHDVNELKSVVLTLGVVKGSINHARLYADIDDMLMRYGSLSLSNLHLGKLMQDMLELAKQHSIMMPQGITMLGRGVMTIEGVLAACCPEVNFVQLMANHLSEDVWSKIHIDKEILQGGKAFYTAMKKAVDLPSQISDFIKMAIRGQSKVNIELVGSEEPLKQIDTMIDKLVICMITAALLVASSLICMTDMKPKLLGIPLLGVLGYLNALVLGGWLLYHIIIKNRRFRK